jgi:hypothetical protein
MNTEGILTAAAALLGSYGKIHADSSTYLITLATVHKAGQGSGANMHLQKICRVFYCKLHRVKRWLVRTKWHLSLCLLLTKNPVATTMLADVVMVQYL